MGGSGVRPGGQGAFDVDGLLPHHRERGSDLPLFRGSLARPSIAGNGVMIRLQDLLNHLYVLMPVLDAEKHYWIGKDEVENSCAKGKAGWHRTRTKRRS